jgi:hypothetical protein
VPEADFVMDALLVTETTPTTQRKSALMGHIKPNLGFVCIGKGMTTPSTIRITSASATLLIVIWDSNGKFLHFFLSSAAYICQTTYHYLFLARKLSLALYGCKLSFFGYFL